MKQIPGRLTVNRFLGVCIGAGVTIIIQSLSATTVMVVSFVNSQPMTLKRAARVIMGTNTGTTITEQLIVLDIGMVAPLIAFMSVEFILFIEKKKVQFAGGTVTGLGILSLDMGMIGAVMIPLGESEASARLIAEFSNSFPGILTGAVFTIVVQSFSVSIGILQVLAINGLIGLDGTVFVLFGQNIDICITAALTSISTNRGIKHTTLVHLALNIIGAALLIAVYITTPFTT